MRKVTSLHSLLLALLVVLLCSGLALAADKTRTKSKKKDGSCLSGLLQQESSPEVAADQIRTKKKDGSCLNTAAIKKQDRKKDGSCLNSPVATDSQEIAATQKRQRSRTKDGSCLTTAAIKSQDRKKDGSC